MMIVHVVLAVATARGWHLQQMDVKNTLLKETSKNMYLWSDPFVFNQN